MNRRNFMKCVGGTGLAMMCDNVLGATAFDPKKSDASAQDKQAIYKDCLRFTAGKKFKIVQFTDVHYKAEDVVNSQPGIDNLNEILDKENPDVVIYTGDLVFSNGTFKGLDAVLEPAIKRNLPFAVVFGNHDDEYDHTRQEMYDYIQKKKGAIMPVRVSEKAPDYVIPIKSSHSEKVEALLYCVDSNAYPHHIEGLTGYGWIEKEQIDWYREVSHQFTAENGGNPLPALAFFHIPVPEFRDALAFGNQRVFGVKCEGIACARLNSGFYLAAKECRDIMGMFVGHDHDNDYAVMYHDIMLAYGRYSGGDTVYNDIPHGARIIELYEGERKMDSYIRLADDVIESKLTYPESFKMSHANKVQK